MKNYNFNNLPNTFCVDITIPHVRLEEFKSLWNKTSGSKLGYHFQYQFYGIDTYKERCSCDSPDEKEIFNGNIISLDHFFALIDELKLDDSIPKIEVGDVLVSKETRNIEQGSKGLDVVIRQNSKLSIIEVENNRIWVMLGGEKVFYNLDFVDKYFTIEKAAAYTPKQGDKVLVRNPNALNDEWQERDFMVTLGSLHFCKTADHRQLYGWDEIKPTPIPDSFTEEDKKLIKELEHKYSVKFTATKITLNIEKK